MEAEAPIGRASSHKKHKGKVPKRIHKAVREKQKREHLNKLFMELSRALDLDQPNKGKASILCEAGRLLDLLSQIELLTKENASLLSESNYKSHPISSETVSQCLHLFSSPQIPCLIQH